MTVATTTNKEIAVGNGVATAFPFPFATLPSGDLVVTLIDADGVEAVQTEGTDYTVSGAGSESGGTVIFTTAPGDGVTVLIQRIVPYTQPTDYKNEGSFYPRTHEQSFDRATMQVQQLAEEAGRTIKIPAQVTGVSTEMPIPVGSTFWGWNADADAPKLYTIGDIATTAAFASWRYDTFTGDGTTNDFTLSGSPGNVANMDVSIDGVTQVPGVDYALLGDTISFAVAPTAGQAVLVRFGQSLPSVGSELFEQIEVAVTAGQSAVTLAGANGDDVHLVYYNGILQHPSAYSVAGTTITFTEALPADGSVVAIVTNVPAVGVSAGNIAYTATGAGATTRSMKSRLDDVVSVKDFGAKGDGVTDDTAAIQAATAYAATAVAELYWPAGDYLTTASIPSLWDVEHTGPGRLIRGAAILPITPTEADAIALYVDPAGNDANDGLTAETPLATVQRAVDIFVEYGARGRWTINLAAGTYTENVDVSSLTPSEFPLDIRGPSVGGTPNVPTAIIAAASAGTAALQVRDGPWVRIYDVKFQDATGAAAVNANGKCRVTLDNVHTANCLNAVIAQHGAFVAFSGGIWNGNNLAGGIGFRSLYNATHEHQPAGLATATLIEDFVTGVQVQEGGQGHIDYLRIHDCTTGIIFRRGCGACNTNQMQIYRCGVGVLAQGSPWFNNGIDFGTGADACTVNARTTGGAPEFDFRSNDFNSRTHRLQDQAIPGSHTGTTTETTKYSYEIARPWMISEGGDAVELEIGVSNAALAGTANVRVYLNDGTTDDLIGGVLLPAGTTTAAIRAVIMFSSATGQRGTVSAIHNAGTLVSYGTGALSLKNLPCTLKVTVTLSNSADTLTMPFLLLKSTLGG